ncbi:hypothetical protein K3495_g2153 [Podosphaera aphanis]|nr:hypothetical protein K3495_g2153 [Podosphaera aphanis]
MSSRKRPAPTLLPAFELSSSPGFSRPSKKQSRTAPSQRDYSCHKYPTPIPSSTTGILSSPPPQILNRSHESYSQSSIHGRIPPSSIPSVTLPENGQVFKFGRSSLSSNYQISANRLISRVHAEAHFIAATAPLEPNKIKIRCTGWNGLKIHSSAQTWELKKGDTFTSETEYAEIVLDVQEVRILIAWPTSERCDSWSYPIASESLPCASRYFTFSEDGDFIHSIPRRYNEMIKSPVSPSPDHVPKKHMICALDENLPIIQIHEGEPLAPIEFTEEYSNLNNQVTTPLILSSTESNNLNIDESDNSDEENNPAVNSRGLSTPLIDTSISQNLSESRKASSLLSNLIESPNNTSKTFISDHNSQILNHVIDQLAFSLKSSTPISDLYENLPAALKQEEGGVLQGNAFNLDDLRRLLFTSDCIGEISREGKDAAGKPLESQYYYIAEQDTEEERRNVVLNLRRPSLRNCRKQHKQYYWKKPKTP